MFRRDVPIPTIERDKYPKRILVFDTEAFRGEIIEGTEIQTYRLGVLRFVELSKTLDVIKDEVEYCYDPRALATAIEQYARKDKALYVYAHNIKYDLQLSGMLTTFIEAGWKVKLFVMDDPPTFIRISKNRSSIVFVDTFNYWQTSVEQMGKQLGNDKLVMPNADEAMDNWKEYCKRDVDVLMEYLLTFMRFLRDNDLCGLGLTLASQSFRTYRHNFMQHIIQLHSDENATKIERQAYSGGRVEAYYIGTLPEQDYYKLDINSMYPFVMKEKLYPYELIAYSENDGMDQFIKLLDQYYCIANVSLNTPENAFAYKGVNKLIFPIGSYDTTLHDVELRYALERGYITAINSLATYKYTDIFSDYIKYFYEMKISAERSGNMVIRQQAKILMNSLYGKFGQRNNSSYIIPNTTETKYGRITGYSERLGCQVTVNCLGDDMEVSYQEGEAPYSFPAIAGAVTAYARMYLYRLIQEAGQENVYYCDTDSLIVNRKGFDRMSTLIDTTALGLLKLEGQSRQVVILGAKDYTFADEVKHKGVPKKAVEVSPGKWQYQQFRGGKTWVADGLSSNVEVYTRTKERKTRYDKGVINADNTVSPIELRRVS